MLDAINLARHSVAGTSRRTVEGCCCRCRRPCYSALQMARPENRPYSRTKASPTPNQLGPTPVQHIADDHALRPLPSAVLRRRYAGTSELLVSSTLYCASSSDVRRPDILSRLRDSVHWGLLLFVDDMEFEPHGGHGVSLQGCAFGQPLSPARTGLQARLVSLLSCAGRWLPPLVAMNCTLRAQARSMARLQIRPWLQASSTTLSMPRGS